MSQYVGKKGISELSLALPSFPTGGCSSLIPPAAGRVSTKMEILQGAISTQPRVGFQCSALPLQAYISLPHHASSKWNPIPNEI
ncbi:hypothetical protein NQZ68_014452 [Dissostichus eleginoides]|nr:hypothetical protein NQZ68_014452 [Dissostichus eleginoides]